MAILNNKPKKETNPRPPVSEVDITEYEGLLHSLLYKFTVAYGSWILLWKEDLLQEGRIGLMKALEVYDPDRGTFVTIGWLKVHTAMSRYINGLMKVRENEIFFLDYKADIEKEDGKQITWEETVEGVELNYNALVWHFTNWRDRRAALGIFEGIPNNKRRILLKESQPKADERFERVFHELITLVGIWYGGTEMDFPSLAETKKIRRK